MDRLFLVQVLKREDVQAELTRQGVLCAGTGALTGLVAAALRGYRVSTAVLSSSAGFTLAGVPFFALQRVFQERRNGAQDSWNAALAGGFVGWFIALGISGPLRCPQGALTLAMLSGTTHWVWTGIKNWKSGATVGIEQATSAPWTWLSWPEWLPIQPVRPGRRPLQTELAELLATRAALEAEIREQRAQLAAATSTTAIETNTTLASGTTECGPGDTFGSTRRN
jgi:hypothetical protein